MLSRNRSYSFVVMRTFVRDCRHGVVSCFCQTLNELKLELIAGIRSRKVSVESPPCPTPKYTGTRSAPWCHGKLEFGAVFRIVNLSDVVFSKCRNHIPGTELVRVATNDPDRTVRTRKLMRVIIIVVRLTEAAWMAVQFATQSARILAKIQWPAVGSGTLIHPADLDISTRPWQLAHHPPVSRAEKDSAEL